jgi:glycosyltransferase involved in cell wall biosynthesis
VAELSAIPMRLAVFTPLAPVRSGISAYAAELLPWLVATHAVDVYVEEDVYRHYAGGATDASRPRAADAAAPAAEAAQAGTPPRVFGASLYRAHDFVSRQVLAPYDLIVYQLGNAMCHEYMWPYLMRYPGLVVLHDGQLHHSRARALLRRDRKADYRAEFRYAHPDANPDIAEFVVAGLQGPVYYIWPLLAAVVRRARLVAVHNPRLAADLREAFPDARIESLTMGVADLPGAATSGATSGVTRDRVATGDAAATGETGNHSVSGIAAPDAAAVAAPETKARPVTFAAFGLITPEKRIPQILRALGAIARVAPGARLRLIGDTAPHYDVRADAEQHGVADRVTITGFVSDDALSDELRQCDVCLCLRWPTTRETSASWLRCLAAGKATVINDLTHLVDVPTLDPRSWTVLDARTDAIAASRRLRSEDAVAVSIDILDEDHSLELAMRRLATDGDLRASLARAARGYYEAHHTLPLMAADYARVIAHAVALAAPDPAEIGLPAHLLDDRSGRLRHLLAEIGLTEAPF